MVCWRLSVVRIGEAGHGTDESAILDHNTEYTLLGTAQQPQVDGVNHAQDTISSFEFAQIPHHHGQKYICVLSR